MYACAALTLISCATIVFLLERGIIIGLPVFGFFLATMILAIWDDDWLDRKGAERGLELRAQAIRCTTCWTALLLGGRRNRGYCLRCRTYRPMELPLPPPPP